MNPCLPPHDPHALSRRGFVTRSAALAAGALGAASGHAAVWPSKPVRLVVAFPAGGGVDGDARTYAQSLSQHLGRPFTVENKGGASTILAAQQVLSAPADGHTFLVAIGLTMYLPAIMDKVPFNPATDLVPVGPLAFQQLMLVANAKTGIKSFEEMRRRVRANPDKLPFATYGAGTDSHLLAVQLNRYWDTRMMHVPYRGSAPTIQAVVAGEVAFTLGPAQALKQHIATGAVVPLAVRGEPRSPFFPQVPTLSELGVEGFELPIWSGVFAARGTPQQALQGMSQALQRAAGDADLKAQLAGNYALAPQAMDMPAFSRMAQQEAEVMSRMMRASGIRLE